MKLRLAVFALTCSASLGAWADAEHDRIAADRAAANAKLADEERECETRFIVAPCLESARKEQRATLTRLRQEELKLDEAKRHAAAAARRKAISDKADKAEAQQAKASDAQPEPPHVRVRHGLQANPASAPAKQSMEIIPPHSAAKGASGVDRAAIEQQNEEKFKARTRAIEAHRDAIERRNAQRAAHGKVAAPLPVASGASAPPR